MRCFIICLFLIFCVQGGVVLAQQGQIIMTEKEIQKNFYKPIIKDITYPCFASSDTTWIIAPKKKIFITPNFYTQNMGAVCKVELKMQKQLKFPLFIRIGSKDYVDALEGKFGTRR